jgi:hypothetical protein
VFALFLTCSLGRLAEVEPSFDALQATLDSVHALVGDGVIAVEAGNL